MLRKLFLFFGLAMAIFLLQECTTAEPIITEVEFNPEKVPYQKLSEYGFFTDLHQQKSNKKVLAYEPITPLFTDYAHKARFVWMPDSVSAQVDEQGVIRFPDNSVLIKTFYYPNDFATASENQDLIETRLLMKVKGEWIAYTYVWNEEESDAELNLVGDFKMVAWTDRMGQAQQIDYAIPNKNQCKSCHNQNNVLQPIGPKVRNLNKSFTYQDGSKNQLIKWQEMGYLKAFEDTFTPIADWSNEGEALEDRALAYLEVNCAHCHSQEGSAHTTGLYLTTDEKEHIRLGFCKTPVAAGKGSGGMKYGIVPGQPDSSFLVYRMESDDPGVMMPELGRVIPHREGIQLVRDWIATLEGNCD